MCKCMCVDIDYDYVSSCLSQTLLVQGCQIRRIRDVMTLGKAARKEGGTELSIVLSTGLHSPLRL